MEELVAYRQVLLSALGDTVNRLSRLIASATNEAWHHDSEQNSLTPHFILARLRTLEVQEFTPNIRKILAEEAPLLVIFDDKAWMTTYYKPDEPIKSILDDFTRLRGRELKLLGDMPTTGWSRAFRHPWWGMHTLQWLVELQVEYSQRHVSELVSLMDI